MASKKDATQFTHWKRPVSRMYHYNHQVAESYYKPQMKYLQTGNARRNDGPPGAQTFMERWAADPFYGRTESIAQLANRGLIRASSVPQLYDEGNYFVKDVQNEAENIRESRSRCRSISRERTTRVEESVSRDVRARSRSRSPSRCPSSYYDSDPTVQRRVRARSVSRCRSNEDFDMYVEEEWQRNRELDQLIRMASREERESSVFNIRQSLEDPRALAKMVPMKTTVGLGFYANNLYGKHVWAPTLTLPENRQWRIY